MNKGISEIVDQAKREGKKQYFTGLPCKNGHIARRHVSSGTCEECTRLGCRQFFQQLGQTDKPKRIQHLLNLAKRRAERKGIAFNLSVSDLVIPTHCPILGFELMWMNNPQNKDSSPSLDRIDPKGGYVRGNCIIISWRANRIKQDASAIELLQIGKFYLGLSENKND